MSSLYELTQHGRELEVRAALRNQREKLKAMHDAFDLNTPESVELARLITEMRLSIEKLGPHGVKDWES